MVKPQGKMNTALLHKANKKLILNLVKKETSISRSDITKKTRLTPPTVSKILDELSEKYQLIEFIGTGNSNGGRPPAVVRFKNKGNYIIGIDLGATNIRGSLVDLNGKPVGFIQIPTEINKGFDQIINKMIKIIKNFTDNKDSEDKIWGIGIGVAGLVNRKTGMIESSPIFGWENVDLKKELDKHITIPFFYDNSTRLMAHGEYFFSNSSRLQNFAMINIGYGIAAGLVIDGNIIKGNEGFAGEFGHITVDTSNKVECKCGQFGCLEAMASGHRIAMLGRELFDHPDSKIIRELCNGNPEFVSAEMVYQAYLKGNLSAKKIYSEITDYLAQGIGTIANLLNPSVVYIGGGVSLNGEGFFDMVTPKISKHLLKPNKMLQILPSTFGEQATSIGAAALVLEKILNLNI